MTYSITPSEDRKYIIIKVVGDMTADVAVNFDLETSAVGDKLGIIRYLIDVIESRNVSSVYENYKFANVDLPAKLKVDIKRRIAILVDSDDHSHDFAETVLKNAGSNSTIFRDRELAIQHLMK